ncbi:MULTISPECIES: hypothetical protein [unclassified Nonomuraea]|uniref:hypothetical protein n=1 Tax=unclassified Nonomuraea TaxID=2593643 RepID=UPI0033E4296B
MTPLERRYRRLLAWYPNEHRAVHEDEMLAVLLAATEPGRDRPSARDTLDVLRGALVIRLRRPLPPESLRLWRTAMDLAAFIAPLASLAGRLFESAILAGRGYSGPALLTLTFALPYVLVVHLVCLGRRKAAAACLWAWAALGAALLVPTVLSLAPAHVVLVEVGGVALGVLPACVCAVMLTFAPSPGAGSLGVPRLLGWAAGALAIAVVGVQTSPSSSLRPPAAVALAFALLALRSPVGRRALIALVPIACLFLLPPLTLGPVTAAALAAITGIPLAVTLWLARAPRLGGSPS